MGRSTLLAAAVALAAGTFAGTAAAARAARPLCVGGGPGCYSTLQAAFDAAHDGDTIRIAPGTYAGGAKLDTSVKLKGAGAERTIISGGGPVLTIGVSGGTDNGAL